MWQMPIPREKKTGINDAEVPCVVFLRLFHNFNLAIRISHVCSNCAQCVDGRISEIMQCGIDAVAVEFTSNKSVGFNDARRK